MNPLSSYPTNTFGSTSPKGGEKIKSPKNKGGSQYIG